MKPTKITSVLDMAYAARKKGEILNPMFTGEAGLGKSFICQQWVKEKRKTNPNFGFLDLRIAYMEAPDLIGFPSEKKDHNGLDRTKHLLPEFWPTEGEGLILLEEPNRGTTGVMNCLMQLLTDRKVHNYTLPEGWIIAACINPDSAEYDVNAMDAALRNRFVEFEIEYDHNSFVSYIDNRNYHPNIQNFIKSGVWVYKTSKEVAKGSKYISPRTWSQMQAAELSGLDQDKAAHWDFSLSILGKDIGKEYHNFCYDQAPVTAQDILKDKKAAMKRLKMQSDKNNYQGDMIAVTVESVIKAYGGLAKDCKADQIDEDTMVEVAKTIPSDQAVNLLKGCGFKQSKTNVGSFFKEFVTRHPDLVKILKDNISLDEATNKK